MSPKRARSQSASQLHHLLDMLEVGGSIPSPPTKPSLQCRYSACCSRLQFLLHEVFCQLAANFSSAARTIPRYSGSASKPMTQAAALKNHAEFIWSIADLLRGTYRPAEYRDVMLPLMVLPRLNCVLEPMKATVLKEAERWRDKVNNLDPLLRQVTGVEFYNTSALTLKTVLDDPSNLGDQLLEYINGFSPGALDVLEKFEFRNTIRRLERSNLLYKVLARFCELDLHPDVISNVDIGATYEELIRRFSELSNETAGEHYTPREVIRPMVNLLFIEDRELLTRPRVIRTLYDPACGTGGMLSVSEAYLRELNPNARLMVYGQELNEETYAICRSDLMLKDQKSSQIHSATPSHKTWRLALRLHACQPALRG